MGQAPRSGDRTWGHPWFPHHGQSHRPAKRVCAVCPVQTECLEFSIETGERFGVWGGLSPLQRRYVRFLLGYGFTLAFARAQAERPRYRRSLVAVAV